MRRPAALERGGDRRPTTLLEFVRDVKACALTA